MEECRVAVHVPKKKHGLKTTQNTYGVVTGRLEENGKIEIIQKGKKSQEKPQKLHGLSPKPNSQGKLKDISGALVIEENYGVALDPSPTVIPFAYVWQQIGRLKAANGNNLPRIIRKNQLVDVPRGKNKGRWRISGIKDTSRNGILLVIKNPDSAEQGEAKILVLKGLIRDGLVPLPTNLIQE